MRTRERCPHCANGVCVIIETTGSLDNQIGYLKKPIPNITFEENEIQGYVERVKEAAEDCMNEENKRRARSKIEDAMSIINKHFSQNKQPS